MRTLLILIFTQMSIGLFADIGSSVVYEVIVETKNGMSIQGKIETFGYQDYTYLDENHTNKYCNDAKIGEVLRQISKESTNNTIDLYLKIYYPKYGFVANEKGQLCQGYFGVLGVVKALDVKRISIDEIEKVSFVAAENNKRSWLYSELQLVTEQQLEWLETRMFNDFWVSYYPTEGAMDGVILLNYDAPYDREKFEQMIKVLAKRIEAGECKRSQEVNEDLGNNFLIFINRTC